MKKSLSLFVLLCLFIMACQKAELSTEPTPVEMATTPNVLANNNGSEVIRDIPVSDVFYNECCDEEVFVTGKARLVINKNIMQFVVTELTGTGLTTGFHYMSQIPSVSTNIFYSNPFEGILTFMINMSSNDGCSFRLKLTFRLNVNVNGETVVDFQKTETFCN